MAIYWAENGVSFGSSPSMLRRVGFDEIGRTANSVTMKVYLELKINASTTASFYGYPMSWTVNGASAGTIKTSARWYGGEAYRQFTYTFTKTGLSASGGSLSIPIVVTSTGGGNCSFSKTYSAGYSTFNTAPYWASGSVLKVQENNSSGRVLSQVANGTENAVKVAENISNIYISWNAGSDADNNISRYELHCQVDNGAWSRIYSGTARSYTHNIGSGSGTQGKMYDYYVIAVDSYGLASPHLDATQFQKNVLTPARLTVSSALSYSSTGTSVSFSGASNTNGNTSFTYKLSSPQLTIYNPTITGNTTLSVYKSGTAPSTPYVKFDDLKNLTKNSNWTGSFTLQLTTTNAYGSSGSSTYGISVDLRTNPKAPTVSLTGRHSVQGLTTYISGLSTASVSWSGAQDYLGGALTYTAQYSLDNSSWTNIVANTSSTGANLPVPTVTAASTLYFRVIAKTTFGYTATSSSVSCPLHYYKAPTITFSNPVRASSTMKLTVSCKVNTSIPNVALSSRSWKGLSGTANTFAADTYTLTDSGLKESSTYNITVTVTDNSGLSGNSTTATYGVKAQVPILSVREKGVGVNCVNTGSYNLLVNGSANVTGDLKVNGNTVYHSGKGNKHGNWFSGNPVLVGGDGVSEIGKYIDFHLTNTSTADNDGRITLTSANAWDFNGSITASKLNSGGDVWVGARLVTSATVPSSSNAKVLINTSGDSNGIGDGNTHFGYNSGGKYNHYLRGSGTTYIDTPQTVLSGATNVSKTLTVKGLTEIHNDVMVKNTSSGISGHLWSGTGGFVVQGEAGANLHLGANNSSNDITIDSSIITMNKPVTAGIYRTKEGSALGNVLDVNGGQINLLGSNGVVTTGNGYLVLRSASEKEIYLQGSQVRAVAPLTTGTYRPMYASAFNQSSTGASKTKIKSVDNDDSVDTMQLLKDTNVYTYHLTDEVERGYYHNKKIGFIAEATPKELKAEGEQAIDLYSMASTLWDVCKQQQETIEKLQKDLEELTEIVGSL